MTTTHTAAIATPDHLRPDALSVADVPIGVLNALLDAPGHNVSSRTPPATPNLKSAVQVATPLRVVPVPIVLRPSATPTSHGIYCSNATTTRRAISYIPKSLGCRPTPPLTLLSNDSARFPGVANMSPMPTYCPPCAVHTL